MKGAFAWSVRREVWEHRSVWMAPLAVAGFVLVAFLLGARTLGEKIADFATLTAEQQQLAVAVPFGLAASVILLTAFLVGAFYSIDALHSERRDRSILFWKSMPVSDTITVLSKAFVPFAVIPAIAFVIALATQLLVLILAAVLLTVFGADAGAMLATLPVFTMTIAMLYGVVVHALWYLPLFALMMVVSALVRRPLVWVVVPLIAVQVLERIAFGTSHANALIQYRLMGALSEAFKPNALRAPITSLSQLDPIRILTSPGLWLGLLAAAALLAAAIYLRRSREPL